MVFHMPQKRIQLPLLKIAGADIESVDNLNFLGIIINTHLNWTSHVDMLIAKLSKTIGILNTLNQYNEDTLKLSNHLPFKLWSFTVGSQQFHVHDILHILQKKLFLSNYYM